MNFSRKLMTKAVFEEPYSVLHISPSFNRDIIQKQGLLPRSKNPRFRYPARVHMFFPYKEFDIKSNQSLFMLMEDLFQSMLCVDNEYDTYDVALHSMLWNYRYDKKNYMADIDVPVNIVPEKHLEEIFGEFGLDVYKVDKSSLVVTNDFDRYGRQAKGNNTGVHFYKDPSVKDGLYTYDHIPRTALTLLYEDVSFHELTKIRYYYKGNLRKGLSEIRNIH